MTRPRTAAEHKNDFSIAIVIISGRIRWVAALSVPLDAIPINLSRCQFAFNLFHFFAFPSLCQRTKGMRQQMDVRRKCVAYLGHYGNEIITLQSALCSRRTPTPDTVRLNLLSPRLEHWMSVGGRAYGARAEKLLDALALFIQTEGFFQSSNRWSDFSPFFAFLALAYPYPVIQGFRGSA